MRKDIRKIALLGAVALVATAFPLLSVSASHSGNLTVQVGEFFPIGANCNPNTFRNCRGAESMRFLAPTLRVHEGDIINFEIPGFHTATLLPRPTDVDDWAAENAGGTDKPFSLLMTDPDDTEIDPGASAGKPSLKANPDAAFPSSTDCGSAGQPPCDYNGTEVVNSGVPEGEGEETPSFSVTINAAPSDDAIWVICLVHPHMRLRIKVVDDAETPTSQSDIDSFRASAVAADQDWAEAKDAKLLNTRRSHVTAGGRRVFDVQAGVDSHTASILAMYPRKLTIRRGQRVRYHFDDLIYEIHTASLPFGKALQVLEDFFAPVCDPDGDSGPGPDEPASPPPGPPCDPITQLEIDVPARGAQTQGDRVFNGSDYQNSGIRGATFDTSSFNVRFNAVSGRRGFRYFCLVHGPFMDGRVRVRPRR